MRLQALLQQGVPTKSSVSSFAFVDVPAALYTRVLPSGYRVDSGDRTVRQLQDG